MLLYTLMHNIVVTDLYYNRTIMKYLPCSFILQPILLCPVFTVQSYYTMQYNLTILCKFQYTIPYTMSRHPSV